MTTNRRHGPLVDAEPIRRHVYELMAAGVAYHRIAKAAGVATSTINHMLYDRHNRARTQHLNHENARRILAVQADQVATGYVDATGSSRRIRALMAIGWPPSHLGHRVGLNPNYVNEVQRTTTTLASTAHAVAVTYNQLWDKNPEHHGVGKQAATRMRNYARTNGWPPPAAWDDDALDDPKRGPATCTELTLKRGELAAYRREEIEFLDSCGRPEHEIAQRLGVALSTVQGIVLELRRGERRERKQVAA